VEAGARFAEKEDCDGLVVIGGGSPLCAGRAIALLASNGGHIKDYAGLMKYKKPPLPLVAIPSTAGSGAEVSQFILLKDKEAGSKMVVGGPACFPEVAILDPLIISGLPYWQFVVSGIDALSHAVEAYFTSLTTPITDALAAAAIRLMYENLGPAAASPDLEAKEACLIGSSMANMACGNARLGLAHAMTVPMEGMFKIPHGIAVGTVLPYVMEFNLPAAKERFAHLAVLLGQEEKGVPLEELAVNGIEAIKNLYLELNFPRKYDPKQVDPEAIPEMVGKLMGGLYGDYDPNKKYPPDAVVLTPNIRKATMADVIDIFQRSFQGWDPRKE
jgi:alcohol dehydrogenase class IV